eukprot:TRINITY_DN2614_c4_g1_i1.p1 TRINITY_DN2614_c4_g1~~TRINITY_DN2614_c4_g1_i1.p1  ORF type:complete len:588 (+),score=123.57 TRINITY_DN2614_c4_g1_i1:119-1882(+)
MLSRCCALLSAPRRGARAVSLTPGEQARLRVFVHSILRDVSDKETDTTWHSTLSQRYRGVTVVSPTNYRKLLSVAAQLHELPDEKHPGRPRRVRLLDFIPKLVAYAGKTTGEQYRMQEPLVVATLAVYLHQVKNAKRRDMTCYAGSPTHKTLLDMFRLFNWFRSEGHGVDQKAWTVMLQGASAARFTSLVRFILKDMMKENIAPDPVILSTVVRSFSATSSAKEEVVAQLRRECLGVWAEMRGMGVTPDAKCYSALISVLNSFGDYVHAEQVFQEMKNSGFSNALTAETYTAVLAGISSEERLHQVIREMSDKGVSLDRMAFSSLLKAMRRIYPGNTEKAEAVFETAIREKVAIDEYLCTAMLLVYREASAVQKGADFLARMINELKVVPTHASLNTLLETALRCTVREGDIGFLTAEWVWKYTQLHRVYTHHTFGFMMDVYLKAHNPQRVISVFSVLKSSGLMVTLHHFDSLIQAYVNLGETAAADAIRRLPRYKELLSAKSGMTEGRRRREGASFSVFADVVQRAPSAVVSRREEGAKPKRSEPAKIRDTIGRQLANAADCIEKAQFGEAEKVPDRYHIDDVLGL